MEGWLVLYIIGLVILGISFGSAYGAVYGWLVIGGGLTTVSLIGMLIYYRLNRGN